MESWPDPGVPSLPGRGGLLRLHDTASGRLVDVTAHRPARIYVCGVTPYDATHLGHAATYVAFDLANRTWRDGGQDVHYVLNVTDIDDPLLERANRDGEDWVVLAERETALFRADMAALRVLPPRDFVGAVEAIPEIVELVGTLCEQGAAYELDGDVYFSVAAATDFGRVAGLDRPTMLALSAERGGDPDRVGKKDPLDCLLWQAARPGEPAWDSSFGPGRPGWHIECTAIALRRLGPTIDVQGGGSDLAFPHHELGAAEARVITGVTPFARAFVHAGMVGLDGEKMSKSRGNLVFVSTLRRQGAEPATIRLALLAHHYRSDWEWTAGELPGAQRRLDRWRSAVARAQAPPAVPVLDRVRRALAADLEAPAALAAVDAWAAADGDDRAAPALVRDAVDALLGVTLSRRTC